MPPKTRFQPRHQYDDERDEQERRATDIEFNDLSLTVQSVQPETDINIMLKRMGLSDGALPPAAIDPKYFGDFTDATDLRTAIDRTRDAVERFNSLPADTRRRFHNDPAELWEFVNDPNNDKESIELGLLSKHANLVIGADGQLHRREPDPEPAPPKPPKDT